MNTRTRLSVFLFASALFGFVGCSSLDLPSVEDSQKNIDRLTPQLQEQNDAIMKRLPALPGGSDLVLRMRLAGLNAVLSAFTRARTDDITINFPPTRPLFSEQKSILGISYTNQLDVNSGLVVMDIKSFTFDKFEQNKIDATLEIEGKGNISVSGKYTGVPASVAPEIDLYLKECIRFDVTATDTGTVVLRPQPKTMILKTKISVKLLEWKVPWYQELPLQLTDMIKPVALPIALTTEIPFPLPATKAGGDKLEYVPFYLQLSKTTVALRNGRIECSTNIDFKKK